MRATDSCEKTDNSWNYYQDCDIYRYNIYIDIIICCVLSNRKERLQ